MKTPKPDTLFASVVAGITLLVLLAHWKLVNPYFIAFGVGSVLVLKVVKTAARQIPGVSDRRLDYQLQMSLLDHHMSKPAFSIAAINSLVDGVYREPEYHSRIVVMAGLYSHSENTAKYN